MFCVGNVNVEYKISDMYVLKETFVRDNAMLKSLKQLLFINSPNVFDYVH
jgi:hypothetical protein